MHTTAKYILLCLILTFANTLCAQISGIHSYTINDDGASPKILTLIKSSKGFLLAGTANGLYRFDGRQFSYYNFSDTPSKKAITAIAEDKDGKIWLGLQSGQIGYVENKLVKLLNPEEGHPAAAITSILQDASQTVFFATAGEGIYYYQNKRFYNINTDDGLSDNYVYDLLPKKQGVIACTDRGLNIINSGSKKNYYLHLS
jgi:ligand-binding sensor domain-containing protein